MPSNMRCFKSFFKHTWHPQQMTVVPSPSSMWDYPQLDQVNRLMGDPLIPAGPPRPESFPSKNRIPEPSMESSSRFESSKTELQSETELGEVKVTTSTSSIATSTPIHPVDLPCRTGGCKAFRNRIEPRAESPWHMLKTVFLVSVIVALLVWVIVYTLLAQYQIV